MRKDTAKVGGKRVERKVLWGPQLSNQVILKKRRKESRRAPIGRNTIGLVAGRTKD